MSLAFWNSSYGVNGRLGVQNKMSNIILLGGNGHAKVIIDMLHKQSDIMYDDIFLLDDNENLIGQSIMGHKVVGPTSECVKYKEDKFVIAIGNNAIRKMLAQKYDLDYISVVHPAAIIGEDVVIEKGTVIMAGAVINSGVIIGKHCVVNTGAMIDHDCKIGDYVHLSPGVHLGGTVSIDNESWMGIGSCCKNNVNIGKQVVIGAGGVVVGDILESGTYVGVPAKKMN